MPSCTGKLRPDSFFTSLTDLENVALPAHRDDVIPYTETRSGAIENRLRGRKLLVCHDYKGGYNEDRADHSYTFNFWQYCDTFIYFSHHRVTLPPSGWINAAHRQGSKIIGTLIFEHSEGEEDCLRLLLGPLSTKSGQKPPQMKSLPVSAYYAKALAVLARQRGFDGYLLNFECPFRGGPDQMRTLCEWIEIFRVELKKEIGEHAELIWYDSVVINGKLAWQDRLNHYNLPFFVPSTGFFTNYTWRPHYPNLMSDYFSKLPLEARRSKTLSDIFVGVDVWGRGQHGGGMLNCHKALSHIYPSPPNLGTAVQGHEYAVALFGQAWTWESVRDEEQMDWETWFRYEQKFWLGEPASHISSRPTLRGDIGIPKPNPPRPQPPCSCDTLPYTPLTAFFASRPRPAPDPMTIPLCTTFSPGVGDAWFVEGAKVDGGGRWTDVDKQTSLGDLVWPDPKVYCEDVEMQDIWLAESRIDMNGAWIGGSSLRLSLKYALESEEGEDGDNFFSLYIPVQSVSLTSGQAYDVTLVYKLADVEDGVDVDLGLAVRQLSANGDPGVEVEVAPLEENSEGEKHGWSRVQGRIVPSSTSEETTSGTATLWHIGLQLSIFSPSSTILSKAPFSIQMGLLAITPSITHVLSPIITSIEATPDPIPSPSSTNTSPGSAADWVHIQWNTAHTFSSPLNFLKPSLGPDDTRLAWAAPPGRRAHCMYFNVYAEPLGGMQEKGLKRWLGTTGVDMPGAEYWVSVKDVKDRIAKGKDEGSRGESRKTKLRIWVQGVTDIGEVMSLEESCAGSSYVDFEIAL